MRNEALRHGALLSAAGGALVANAQSAEVDDLLAKIKSADENVRTAAWQSAGPVGATAIKPLAAAMLDANLEVGRAARQALFRIVRHAGRPGADQERPPVVAELLSLLGDDQQVAVRREVLWMVSEIGGDEAVDAVAAVLKNDQLREDARLVLQRIPGDRSLAALKAAIATVPEEFKFNLAASLRARGQQVDGYPDQKLVPTKQTQVKPVGR